jgi:plastocyanin
MAAIVVAITAMMLALVMLLGFAGATQILAQLQLPPRTNTSNSSNSLLNAEAIYGSNSITTDSDVKDLVIMIPDSSLRQYGSKWQGFLPNSATIVSGTNVTWVNADVNASHGITLSSSAAEDDEDGGGQIFEEASIPYQNGTTYMFDEEGEYTFADPATGINGTITVVSDGDVDDDPVTNSSRPTVGLIAVPASDDARFSSHLNRLGFNAVSSFSATEATNNTNTSATTGGGNTTATTRARDDGELVLHVWSQAESDAQTVINRFASKLRTLEGILYPGDAVKQS